MGNFDILVNVHGYTRYRTVYDIILGTTLNIVMFDGNYISRLPYICTVFELIS